MIQERFSCKSTSNDETYLFENHWTVQKNIFQRLVEADGIRRSADFQTKFYNSWWHLELFAKQEFPQHFGFKLILGKADTDLNFDFCYRLTSGDTELTEFTSFDGIMSDGNSWGYDEWKEKEILMLKEFWPTDFLTIIVKIKIEKRNQETVYADPLAFIHELDTEPISQDYASLISSGLYSDVTLIVGDKKLSCHKNILALRCKYFATMFKSNFKEAIDSNVEIKDIEGDDFECLLQFIYSGQYPVDSALSKPSLLIAADRFSLSPVVKRCENYLIQNITTNNCLELFQVADLCSRSKLKHEVKEFIKENIGKVTTTESWKSLKAQSLTLSIQILESVFEPES